MFVSSTLGELAPERAAARDAIERLRFTPVLFELGARPHPPRALYRAYLDQSDVFVGIYWRRYGWVAPGMEISGLEDEYVLARSKPKLVYVKTDGEPRELGLRSLLERISADAVSYRPFETAEELADLLADDLALLVSERFPRPSGRGGSTSLAIPAPVSSFVGRESEIGSILSLLDRHDVRLLTLLGAGGIGKTRLAFEAARRRADGFDHGAAVVELARVSAPADVVPAIAEAFGISGEPGPSLEAQLRAHLEELEVLLVLDNLEHLLEAAPFVGELLQAAPGLKVLATSRSRLAITGEHCFRVPPLGLPAPDERGVEAIRRSDAARLFAARLEATGWTTTDADAPLVADIVRRLDGLPLAIELAAAQARLGPPELVHSRLGRRLDFGAGPRDAEERHRTLRSTIAWSYDLLDEPGRRFFEKLAIFAGGFSLDAAAALVADGEDVEELLASIVDASLLTTVPSAATGVRFSMLETIREYAGERLDDRGARSNVARSHLAFFAQLADDASDASPERKPLMRRRLDEERENLRAAYWEAIRTTPDDAVRLAGALGTWFSQRGLNREGRGAVVRALSAAPDAPPKWRARALAHASWLAAEQDECAEADRLAREALALFRSLGDKRGIGMSFNSLGYSAATREDVESALGFYREAYRAFSEADNHLLRLYAGTNMATVLTARGELDEARRLYADACEQFEGWGFDDELAIVRYRLAELEEVGGDLAAAREGFDAAAAGARRSGNRRLLAWALMRLGHVAAAEGRIEDAGGSYSEALDLHDELGQQSGVACCVEYVARLASMLRRAEDAARLLGYARTLREAIDVPPGVLDQPEVAETEQLVREELGVTRYEQEAALGMGLAAPELAEFVRRVVSGVGPVRA